MKSTSIVCAFPNIRPVCTFDGITNTHIPGWIRREVHITPVQEPKTIFSVSFRKKVVGTDYVERMRDLKLQPCRNAPAYLLGLTVSIPEDEMPPKLQGKSVVAAEPGNQRSTFNIVARGGLSGPRNQRCYLYLDRRWSPEKRILFLLAVNPNWPIVSTAEAEKSVLWDASWAFLAEKL